jgi:hypothetical protein
MTRIAGQGINHQFFRIPRRHGKAQALIGAALILPDCLPHRIKRWAGRQIHGFSALSSGLAVSVRAFVAIAR